MEPCAIVPLPGAVDPSSVVVPVAGEAPLVRIVRAVLHGVGPARVVVAVAPTLATVTRDCLSSAGLDAVAVVVASHPASRGEVLVAGLEHLGLQPHSPTPVLLCDHRYPLAPGELAERVLDGVVAGHEVVVPVLPVTDTVKTVDELGSVLSTVDRSALRTVQYPRGFTAAALWDAISGPPASPRDGADEVDAVLRAGVDVATVVGHPDALRFELPRDAPLLDAIIGCRLS